MKNIKTNSMISKAAMVSALVISLAVGAVAGQSPYPREFDFSSRTGRCGEHSLKGTYGYNISGTLFMAPGVGVPLASVGRIVFDGTGYGAGNDTNSFNGMISSDSVTGTYTVNPDCTGTLNVVFSSSGFEVRNNIVIVDEGRQFHVIQTNPGAVVAGTFRRQ